MTEAEFQRGVIDAARLFGWRVAHFRPSMNRRGKWSTPIQADGAGFPDLVLVRADRIVFAELKSPRGRLSVDQAAWLDALRGTSIEVYVWSPHDWDEIDRILRRYAA